MQFPTPADAFKHYCPHGLLPAQPSSANVDLDRLLAETFGKLDIAESVDQLSFISSLLRKYASSRRGLIVPNDFLELTLSAMDQLKAAGRTNVVYNLVKSIGTKRRDENESRLPVSRMPLGLIEHTVNFFSSSNLQQVWYTCIQIYMFIKTNIIT